MLCIHKLFQYSKERDPRRSHQRTESSSCSAASTAWELRVETETLVSHLQIRGWACRMSIIDDPIPPWSKGLPRLAPAFELVYLGIGYSVPYNNTIGLYCMYKLYILVTNWNVAWMWALGTTSGCAVCVSTTDSQTPVAFLVMSHMKRF